MGRGRRTRADRARTPQATTVALTIALLLGSIPAVGALGAGPTEDPRRAGPAASLPCEPGEPAPFASPFDADRRRLVEGGCRSWQSRSAPADVVALEPIDDGETFLHARDDDGRIVVERRQARTGSVGWRTQLEAPGDVGRLNLLVAEASDQVYVGWEHDDQGADRPRAELGGADWSPGGLARLSLGTGTVDWHRAPGSAGLGLAAEQDTLYYAYTEGGYLRFDDGDLEEDNATLVVTAVDPNTGATRWTNETDAWWTSHAYDDLGPDSSSSCVDGPAHVTVSDGITYVARGQRCTGVPIAVAGFAPDGEMAFLSSYPDEHADTAWGEGRIWGSGLAVHPNGRILYATASDLRPSTPWGETETRHGAVVAFDLVSREVLWSWYGGATLDPKIPSWTEICSPWGPGCFAEHGIHDVEVTRRGEVVLAGFDDRFATRTDRLAQLVVLDGLTGEALSPPDLDQMGPAFLTDRHLEGAAFDAELTLGPDHRTAYAVYRTDVSARALGFPLFGDRAGSVWEAEQPSGAENTWIRDIAVSPHTTVGAGPDAPFPQPAGGSGSQLSGFVRGLANRAYVELHTEASGAESSQESASASSAATGIVHGERAVEGVPTVYVNATDRVHAEVNISEPGIYYLFVDGVTPFQRYALDGLPIDQEGVNQSRSPACTTILGHRSVLDVTRSRAAGCEETESGVCSRGWEGVASHPTWRRKCWGTGKDDPATVARADAPPGEEGEHDGAVLFGPLLLTEGRYAVVEADQPALDALNLAWRCAAPTLRDGTSGSGSVDLPACIEVHMTGGGKAPSSVPRTAPARADQGGAGSAGSSSTQGGHGRERCPDRWEVGAYRWHGGPVDIQANESDEHARLWHTRLSYLVYVTKDIERGDRCVPSIADLRSADIEFDLRGRRSFDAANEWEIVISARGSCPYTRTAPCLRAEEGSLLVRRPGVLLPDRVESSPTLAVERINEAGHNQAKGEVLESLGDAVVDIGALLFGTSIDVAVSLAELIHDGASWLFPVGDDPFEDNGHRNYECGVGCKEWSVLQGGGPTTFVHRPLLRMYDCGSIHYPIKMGVQSLVYSREVSGHDEPTMFGRWTLDGSHIEQQIPIFKECSG